MHLRIRLLARRRRERGQALVLAALSLLILALMVALSFNLSQALHEKMRLQQHSDAMAYSMAIVEARSFNYFAASNRAMAASYVAMNSLHAYMAAASVTSAMMGAAKANFVGIAVQEFGQCGCWTCFMHCVHGAQAFSKASRFSREQDKYANKVKSVEQPFRDAMKALDAMVDEIHASQSAVYTQTLEAVRSGTSSNLDQLRKTNAPRASTLPAGVGALNAGRFSCAIDGMPCPGGVADTSVASHAKVMVEIANATRPAWPANRGLGPSPVDTLPRYLNLTFLKDLMHDIQGEGASTPTFHHGTAKTIESKGALHGGSSSNNTGKVIGADEHGKLFSYWKHGFMVWPYSAEIFSDSNGGSHSPTHTGQHKFEGVNTKALASCIARGNCFMKFRSDPQAKSDFGQPRVYSYVTQPLGLGDVVKAPWELNSTGSVTYQSGETTGTVTLKPGDGVGLSKALVYYHKLTEWQEQPNMFNPYWRVKLHPFTPAQAAQVLNAAGNTDGAMLTGGANLPM